MTLCAKCGTPILGEPEYTVEITVDESVEDERFHSADGIEHAFCTPRCKRDWIDNLFAAIDEWPPEIPAEGET